MQAGQRHDISLLNHWDSEALDGDCTMVKGSKRRGNLSSHSPHELDNIVQKCLLTSHKFSSLTLEDLLGCGAWADIRNSCVAWSIAL